MIIYPGLIKSDFLITGDDHSFRIWLWETQKDLRRWADNYSHGSRGPGSYADAVGLFSPNKYCLIHEPCCHIGEIHFIKDRWDENIVTHELVHAQFQYIRKVVEDFVRPLYQFYTEWIEWEEILCYEFGRWFDFVWRWLWKTNPNPRWERHNKED